MNQGVYKIYSVQEDEKGNEARRYLGRLAVIQGSTHVLEDHADGILPHMFPDGKLDEAKEQRFTSLQNSAYFQVQTEGLVDTDNVRPMSQPVVKPDEVFSVIDDKTGTKQKLEAYGDSVFLDGKHLDAKALEVLQTQVRNKELHLVPEHTN